MSVEIRLARKRAKDAEDSSQTDNIVTPGDVITSDTGFMRGHGTYLLDDTLHSSVAGSVERVNKLICVRPIKTRYSGEIGDVVIGRVLEVAQKRWKVDTLAHVNSILLLSSVNLPGGELRRRSEEDERMMRQYLKEGDIISAEVHSIYADGSLSLHTRSLKYGKLGQGLLIKVSPSLIKRSKNHFHNMPFGASIILGNNGYIWISPTIDNTSDNTGGFLQDLQPLSTVDREVIARVRNCILAMASGGMSLYDTSILYAYEMSNTYQIKDLIKPEVKKELVSMTIQRLQQEG